MVWTKLGLTKQRMRKLQPKKLHGLHLSKRHYLIAGGAVLLTAALASSAVAKWGHSTDPVTVPEHTRIHVVLDQAVSTGTKPGHHFRATVSRPVVIEGKTVIPKGAHAEGVVVEPRKRDDSRVVQNCCSRCNRWTWTGRTIPFAATLPVNLAVAT